MIDQTKMFFCMLCLQEKQNIKVPKDADEESIQYNEERTPKQYKKACECVPGRRSTGGVLSPYGKEFITGQTPSRRR